MGSLADVQLSNLCFYGQENAAVKSMSVRQERAAVKSMSVCTDKTINASVNLNRCLFAAVKSMSVQQERAAAKSMSVCTDKTMHLSIKIDVCLYGQERVAVKSYIQQQKKPSLESTNKGT